MEYILGSKSHILTELWRVAKVWQERKETLWAKWMDDSLVRNMTLDNHFGNIFEDEEHRTNNNELDYNDNECNHCDVLADLLGNLVRRDFRLEYCMNTMPLNHDRSSSYKRYVHTSCCNAALWSTVMGYYVAAMVSVEISSFVKKNSQKELGRRRNLTVNVKILIKTCKVCSFLQPVLVTKTWWSLLTWCVEKRVMFPELWISNCFPWWQHFWDIMKINGLIARPRFKRINAWPTCKRWSLWTHFRGFEYLLQDKQMLTFISLLPFLHVTCRFAVLAVSLWFWR